VPVKQRATANLPEYRNIEALSCKN